jgi:hypothetical protein
MRFFANIVIKPYIVASGYRSLCEIGAKLGSNTEELLKIDSLVIDIIDPCLDADLCEAYRGNSRIQIHKGISLDSQSLPGVNAPTDRKLVNRTPGQVGPW